MPNGNFLAYHGRNTGWDTVHQIRPSESALILLSFRPINGFAQNYTAEVEDEDEDMADENDEDDDGELDEYVSHIPPHRTAD